MQVSLILAAGGSGRRFRNARVSLQNKVFAHLAGKPILQHALESFRGIPEIKEILVTVPAGTEKWVKTNVLRRGAPPVRLVRGGRTRAESVWNALRKTSPRNEWVLVHDGARPFPPKEAIRRMIRDVGAPFMAPSGAINRAPTVDGIILARPVVPTLKRVASQNCNILETVDRNGLYEAETPQLVRRSVLLEAYRKNANAFHATDESSLVEAVGGKMKILEHSGWNPKITVPEDLHRAEAHLSYPERSGRTDAGFRIGLGRDTHRLVKGRKFYLGGVRIPFEKGTLGHSDGDALLHAISDAILGTVGAGDIGDWFSDKSPGYKNIRSEKLLEKVLEEARRHGWVPSQVDTVIILENPKLNQIWRSRTGRRGGPVWPPAGRPQGGAPTYKMQIRKNLSRLLDLSEEKVSVKTKTAEGLGPEGRGEAVTCEAIVLVVPVVGASRPLI